MVYLVLLIHCDQFLSICLKLTYAVSFTACTMQLYVVSAVGVLLQYMSSLLCKPDSSFCFPQGYRFRHLSLLFLVIWSRLQQTNVLSNVSLASVCVHRTCNVQEGMHTASQLHRTVVSYSVQTCPWHISATMAVSGTFSSTFRNTLFQPTTSSAHSSSQHSVSCLWTGTTWQVLYCSACD